MGITYKDAGVDIDAGESAVNKIKEAVKATYNENVLSDVGQFGGFYRFPRDEYADPVLVSSTDGVGTKLRIAFQTGIHTTIGQDLVNHCVNDILTSGATPLFFLDYIGIGAMDEETVNGIVEGFAAACKENACVLIGGEMAEMAGFYAPGEYDVAGTIVGAVERDNIINGSTIRPGNVVLGLPSTGLHTNGYTLARKVLLDKYDVDKHLAKLEETVGEALLRIHKSYLGEIAPLISDRRLKGIAHITGGGLLGNSRRIIPEGMELVVDWDAWEFPPIFQLIQETGDISDHEMRRTFNCGIGLVIVVPEADIDYFQEHFHSRELESIIIGRIEKSN